MINRTLNTSRQDLNKSFHGDAVSFIGLIVERFKDNKKNFHSKIVESIIYRRDKSTKILTMEMDWETS